MPDQDRIHADLLLAEKRTAAALDAAVTAHDRIAKRLALAYRRPKYLAVGRDGLLRDFGDNADEPLAPDSEVLRGVRRREGNRAFSGDGPAQLPAVAGGRCNTRGHRYVTELWSGLMDVSCGCSAGSARPDDFPGGSG